MQFVLKLLFLAVYVATTKAQQIVLFLAAHVSLRSQAKPDHVASVSCSSSSVGSLYPCRNTASRTCRRNAPVFANSHHVATDHL